MKIVGLVGYAKSGKDTAAAHMPGFKRFAFADELKRMATNMLVKEAGIGAYWGDAKFKADWRDFLVGLGRGMRSVAPDYWINALTDTEEWTSYLSWAGAEYEDEPDMPGDEGVVITDCRYLNEAKWIMEDGGKIVLVVRPLCEPANPEERDSIQQIRDELSPPWVLNDGTPEELGRKILDLVA
jgi:hypothetical protein